MNLINEQHESKFFTRVVIYNSYRVFSQVKRKTTLILNYFLTYLHTHILILILAGHNKNCYDFADSTSFGN